MPYADKAKQDEYERNWCHRNRDKIRRYRRTRFDPTRYVQTYLFERRCSKCGELKPNEFFYQRMGRCKACANLETKQWVSNNLDKHRRDSARRRREWRVKNIEKAREIDRRLDFKRKPQKRLWEQQYRRTNISFRIAKNLRARIRKLLRGQGRAPHPLGCSGKDLMLYLESKFEPGMSWENYGSVWHVDHIVPCSVFDLSRPDHQTACFHFSNLQPLFAVENIRKGAKYAKLVPES
jgi:hypothetical protein